VAGRKGAHKSEDRPRAAVPESVTRLDHVWIPLADGTRLAARIWMPEDAASTPVPGLLEAIPYRKNDTTSVAGRHGYFAQHVRIGARDIRGSGDRRDPARRAPEQEQDDLVETIA
jgi:predicted acyl esterase